MMGLLLERYSAASACEANFEGAFGRRYHLCVGRMGWGGAREGGVVQSGSEEFDVHQETQN